MDLTKLGVLETAKLIHEKKVSCEEVVKAYLKNIEERKSLNAVIEVFEDALSEAKKVDEKIKNNEPLKELEGVPMIIKDNILIKGKKAGCASKFMQNFVAPYDATVIKKLRDAGVIFLGRANMDEFAMGSSTEKSCYGICHNALDESRVPGGSSGGSASAVAANLACATLGSDTGGSIRQPASYNGVYGIKPTYGRVSRFGLIAFASSLDQIGPLTKNLEDSAKLLEIISGKDSNDMTSSKEKVEDFSKFDMKKTYKFGICDEVEEKMKNIVTKPVYDSIMKRLEEKGCEFVHFSIKDFNLCLPIYYVLSTAEATSNLGRFDGVKYTVRSANAKDVNEIYLKSRSEGFGEEVKRRILLGSYVLSSGYFDAYYNKAKKLQQRLTKQLTEVFNSCDAVLLPTTPNVAFKIGSKGDNPVDMYLEDIFTTIANITGVPAISIPCGKGENDLPLGLQVLTNKFEEKKLYSVASYIDALLKGENAWKIMK